MFSRYFRSAALAALTSVAVACGNDPVVPVPSPGGSIVIRPLTEIVFENDNVQLTATVRSETGDVVAGAPVTWAVGDTTIALIANDGTLSAFKTGTVQITARSGPHITSYNLHIMRPPVQSVTVMLPYTELSRGDVALVGVRANGPGSRVVLGRLASITSADPTVAVIDASGRVRGVNAGTTMIRATVDGVTGAAQIRVLADTAELELRQLDGVRTPVLVSTDTLITNGLPDIREVYLENGYLKLYGTAQPRYSISLRYYEYKVTIVNGQRMLWPIGPQSDGDRGLVSYDARGDLQLDSDYYSILHHTGTPLSGGIQVRYRVPGDDIYMNLFFRRY